MTIQDSIGDSMKKLSAAEAGLEVSNQLAISDGKLTGIPPNLADAVCYGAAAESVLSCAASIAITKFRKESGTDSATASVNLTASNDLFMVGENNYVHAPIVTLTSTSKVVEGKTPSGKDYKNIASGHTVFVHKDNVGKVGDMAFKDYLTHILGD